MFPFQRDTVQTKKNEEKKKLNGKNCMLVAIMAISWQASKNINSLWHYDKISERDTQ